MTSNALVKSVNNPLERFANSLQKELNTQNKSTAINFRSYNQFDKKARRKTLLIHKSAPLYMLLSLANSESHNFTSELLLMSSANSWNTEEASNLM